jgi:WD40 repeat protein
VGSAAAGLLLAAVVYARTNYGTVEIHLRLADPAALPRVAIVVDEGAVSAAENEPLRLRAGAHTLSVNCPGYLPYTETFSVRRGTTEVLAVPLVPAPEVAQVRPQAATPPVADKPEPPPVEPEAAPSDPAEVRRFVGHDGMVACAAFSANGNRILTGGADKTVRLWDVATGEQLRRFDGPTESVRAVALSPDGRYAVSGGPDFKLRLWDVQQGRAVWQLAGHTQAVSGVAFTPDSTRVVSSGWDAAVRIWDVAGGSLIETIPENDAVLGLALAADGRRLLVGLRDRTVRLWDLDGKRILHTFARHAGPIEGVGITPDGRRGFSASEDGTLRLWDLRAGAELRSLSRPRGTVPAAAFTPDGRHALSAGPDAVVRLWDLEEGNPVRTFLGHKGLVRGLAVAPDGRHALSAGQDGTVRLWRLPYLPPASVLAEAAPKPKEPVGLVQWHNWNDEHVLAVAFSPDGRRLLGGGDCNAPVLWDLASGQRLPVRFVGHTHWVNDIAYTPDGRQAVSGAADKTVRLWDAETGSLLATFAGHTDAVLRVAVSPDGRLAASGAAGENRIHLWDLAGRQKHRVSLAAHRGGTNYLAFAADGRRLFSAGADGTVAVWDLETGKQLHRYPRKGPTLASPDGRWLLMAGPGNVLRKWDPAGNKDLVRFPVPAGISDLSLSPDGRRALSTHHAAGLVCLWDLATGKELSRFTVAPKRPNKPVFSADGRHAAAGLWRGASAVWRLPD